MSIFTMHLVSITFLIMVNVMVIYNHKVHRIPIRMARSSKDVSAPDRLVTCVWAANNFTLIFLKLFEPRTRLVNASAAACPNCR